MVILYRQWGLWTYGAQSVIIQIVSCNCFLAWGRFKAAKCDKSINYVPLTSVSYASGSRNNGVSSRNGVGRIINVPYTGVNEKGTSQKIRTIGVLCHDGSEMGLRHYLYAGIIERFKSMVERHGYDIFFLSNQIGKTGLSYCEHLALRKADGVLLVNINNTAKDVRELLDSRIPKIAIDYYDESTSCVMTDCDKSMALLYNHLYDLGHRDIVYLHGEGRYLTDERIKGLAAAMAARGESLGPENLVQSKYYSVQGGYAAMKQALGRDKRPTAVIASDDWSAIGVMSAARDMGLAVPDDISIAGFDGFEAAQHMPQKLTTIMQDTTGMGAKAAENLIKQILGVGGKSSSERILLEPKLVIGDSCRSIY